MANPLDGWLDTVPSAPAQPVAPAEDKTNNILAALGMVSQAIGGNTAGGRLGQVAAGMAKGKLTARAAEIQEMKNKAFFDSVIKGMGKNGLTSDSVLEMLKMGHEPTGLENGDVLENTPESFYGVTPKQTTGA